MFPTGRSGIQKIRTGAYRDHAEPMQIVTPRLGKPDIVHYQAPDSADVQAQMTQLVDWFNGSLHQTDGLVRAALAHLWLEAIHPFEDGNGRVGRALVEMALAQDLKTDKRVSFIPGIKGMEELKRQVDGGKNAAAFGLFPVTMSQLKTIADTQNIMPPKTTWIEPKLRSGMVVYDLARHGY